VTSLNPFTLNLHQRPKLACEVTSEGVVAGRLTEAGQPMTAFAPLFAGAFSAGLKTPNIADQTAVVAALKRALDAVETRDKRLTLVVPDAAARVLLLDFDTLPSKVSEALPVVRFRLRKLIPFEADDASVSYQILQQTAEEARVLVIAMPHDVLTEYEAAVRLAGYEPGVVLPSTLASLAGVTQAEPALVVNRNGNSVTTAITRGEELLLHRSMELPTDEILRNDDLRHAVSVSLAYFEDTLSTMPDAVFYAGPGGAPELTRILALEQFRIRDMVSDAAVGTASTVPKGLFAGVAGALAS
jgi:type IV pilus assembly protein PilM